MRIADHIENVEQVYKGSHFYKAYRNDGRHSIVQLFPYCLSADRFLFFEQQVHLLKEAYFEYNAAIPRVLSWGLTKTGSFPFLEMEATEGYDLDEPNRVEKIISIQDISKIAEQISRVLTSCHNTGLIHGDISTKNIIWDSKKQGYILTGFRFGLNTSKDSAPNNKGVVTVSNPEQDNWDQLQQKDVQQFGSILLQLLAGNVTDASKEKIEQYRKSSLPVEWPKEKKEKESAVPAWLINCILKAVAKDEGSFRNGAEMYQYILVHHKIPLQRKNWYRSQPQQHLSKRPPLKEQWSLAGKLKRTVPAYLTKKTKEMQFVFDRNIAVGLIVAALLTGFSIYAQNREKNVPKPVAQFSQKEKISTDVENKTRSIEYTSPSVSVRKKQPEAGTPKIAEAEKSVALTSKKETATENKEDSVTSNSTGFDFYKVRSKAYFYNKPDESTRRNAFIVHWNNATLRPLKENNDFVYIVFTNHLNQTSKGWLRKKDLIQQ